MRQKLCPNQFFLSIKPQLPLCLIERWQYVIFFHSRDDINNTKISNSINQSINQSFLSGASWQQEVDPFVRHVSASKKTKVLVHGFINNGRSPWVLKAKDELLRRYTDTCIRAWLTKVPCPIKKDCTCGIIHDTPYLIVMHAYRVSKWFIEWC